MENRYKRIVHNLKPLYTENSKILILGSFPSPKTREYGFFYGHPNNRFWKIMEKLFKTEIENSIEGRRNFLLEEDIACFDSIFECDIIGASDASIKNVVASDLSEIFECADIKGVFCNGNSSFKAYEKYQMDKYDIKAMKLPSTSAANARYSLDDLIESWEIILTYL